MTVHTTTTTTTTTTTCTTTTAATTTTQQKLKTTINKHTNKTCNCNNHTVLRHPLTK